MAITRREILALIPAAPVAAALPAVADEHNALPSATFEFEKLPVEKHDQAEFRHILKGALNFYGRLSGNAAAYSIWAGKFLDD